MTQKKVNEKPLNKAMALAELQKLSSTELNALLRFNAKFSEQEESENFVDQLSEMQKAVLNAIGWFESADELREARALFFDMCLQFTSNEENGVDETERYQLYGIFQLINH